MIARTECQPHSVRRYQAHEPDRAVAHNGYCSQHGARKKQKRPPDFELEADATRPQLAGSEHIEGPSNQHRYDEGPDGGERTRPRTERPLENPTKTEHPAS